jgi:hypothetical protein
MSCLKYKDICAMRYHFQTERLNASYTSHFSALSTAVDINFTVFFCVGCIKYMTA